MCRIRGLARSWGVEAEVETEVEAELWGCSINRLRIASLKRSSRLKFIRYKLVMSFSRPFAAENHSMITAIHPIYQSSQVDILAILFILVPIASAQPAYTRAQLALVGRHQRRHPLVRHSATDTIL